MYSIAIPTIRGNDRFKDFMESLFPNIPTSSLFEVVVSDDRAEVSTKINDTDKIASMKEALLYELSSRYNITVIYTRPDKWEYLAGNWNNVVKHCNNEYILFLLDDSYVPGPHWCINVLKVSQKAGSNLGCVAIPILQCISPTESFEVCNLSEGRVDKGVTSHAYMLLRKSIWEAMGHWSVASQWCEVEYNYYCWKNNLDIYCTHENTPIHHRHYNQASDIQVPLHMQQGSKETRIAFKQRWGVSVEECSNEFNRYVMETRPNAPPIVCDQWLKD